MKKSTLLLTIIFFSLVCFSQEKDKTFSSFEQAKNHPIIHEGPAPDFFEGALIGNGGLGAVENNQMIKPNFVFAFLLLIFIACVNENSDKGFLNNFMFLVERSMKYWS